MKFSRTTSQVVSINPFSGWNASGSFDMEIAFQQVNTLFSFGGVVTTSAANPGASDLINLYDEYRLDGVEVSFMFGANAIANGPLTTAQLPILDIAFDPSDGSVTTLSSILQFQNLKVVQLGNQRTQDGFVVKCVPTPLMQVGGSIASVPSGPQWISTDFTSIPHFGLKVFYDNAGSALNATIGSVTMYIKYNWSFKLSH